jgi:hypothetical protein
VLPEPRDDNPTNAATSKHAISAWRGTAVRAVLEPITNVYRDVFTAPPWNESDELVDAFVQRLQHECLRPGFTAWTEHDKDEMVGFATGWPTQPPFPDGRSYTAVANQFGRPWVNR